MIFRELPLAAIGFEFPLPLVLAISLGGLALLLLLHALVAYATSRKRPHILRYSWAEWLVYLSFAILVMGLAVSSFGSLLVNGVMEHWGLFAHISLSGAFVAAMLLFAIAWNPVVKTSLKHPWWLSRLSLWGIQIFSIATAGSMLLEMLPILNTEAMFFWGKVHRYSGLLLILAFLTHAYSLLIQRLGWR